jgi:hypothetical protein
MISAASPIAGAQSSSTVAEDGSTQLTIGVKRDVVKVADPLTLQITMTNMHRDKYCHRVVNEEGQAQLNGYQLEVTDSESHIYPLKKQKRLRAWSTSGECIDHGKSTSETMDVKRLVDLDNPGVYHMRVGHLDSMTQQIVWSNSIAVTVEQ